jgi:hypothetical protein
MLEQLASAARLLQMRRGVLARDSLLFAPRRRRRSVTRWLHHAVADHRGADVNCRAAGATEAMSPTSPRSNAHCRLLSGVHNGVSRLS